MLLFLDFDGVTHPIFRRADLSDAFSYLPRLEVVLREFTTVSIVIASDWRKRYTLDELRGFFSEDLRDRIVGVTGIDDTDKELGNRQRLVERYLTEHGLEGSVWLAIDDDPGNYLPGAALVLCDDGFRGAEECALRAALTNAIKKQAADLNSDGHYENRFTTMSDDPDCKAVLAAATALSGDAARAEHWFRTQAIPELDGKTAEALVSEGRAETVLEYIEMLNAGSCG